MDAGARWLPGWAASHGPLGACLCARALSPPQCDGLARNYGVRALPTIVFILKGAKADSVRGADAKAVEAAIERLKPAGGTMLDWGPVGGSASPAASPGEAAFVPYAALAPADKAKADSVVAVCGCTNQVAAAMVQKHKGDVDSATMEVLTSREGAEAFAKDHIPASSTGSLTGHAAAAATAALGSGPGEAPAHAAVPNPTGGATLQFRLGGRPSIRLKESFDKEATVEQVAGYLVTKLPAGATFTLFTRKGASEVPLDMSSTLAAAGLAPRGLVIVNDCVAPAFL